MPKQGERTDIAAAFELFREAGGRFTEEIITKYPNQSVMYGRRMKELKWDLDHKDWKSNGKYTKKEVIVIWGETGTGKSRRAFEDGAIACKYESSTPWGHYEGQEVVLFDEFEGKKGQISWSELSTLIDGYDNNVRLLYHGNQPWIPKRIYICSNRDPSDWYTIQDGNESVSIISHEQRLALYRRFTEEWHYFRRNGKIVRLLKAPRVQLEEIVEDDIEYEKEVMEEEEIITNGRVTGVRQVKKVEKMDFIQQGSQEDPINLD